jgi:hypothetical protein
MMQQKQILTRRQVLVTSAAFATAGVLDGCGSEVLIMDLLADSIFFLPITLNIVAAAIYDYGVHPAIEAVVPTAKAANTAGANAEICKEAARLAGNDFVVSALKNGTPIWCSNNEKVREANAFSITIKNSKNKVVGGQFNFGLQDIDKPDAEHSWWSDPFAVQPHAEVTLSFSGYQYSFIPGNKRIVALSSPTGIEIKEVGLIVLPMTLRYESQSH